MTIHLPEKQEDFTPKEAAFYLGVDVKTIYQWIQFGKIEADRIGEKLLKIPRVAILGAKKDL